MSSNPQLLRSAIHNIFDKSDDALRKKVNEAKLPNKANKKQLELAVTVLLVDLASCDQSFDPEEYQTICLGLMRLGKQYTGERLEAACFRALRSGATSYRSVQSILKHGLDRQAKVTLANMRGTARFASLLKDSLSHTERQEIMDVINEVIMADGSEDGFETYIRNKLRGLLGLEEKP